MATQMYADAMPGRVPEGLTDGSLLGDHPLQGRIAAGLEPYLAGRALFTVYSYVVGFTIEEQAVYPFPGKRDSRYDETPTAWGFDKDVEGRFSDGLTMVLGGVFA